MRRGYRKYRKLTTVDALWLDEVYAFENDSHIKYVHSKTPKDTYNYLNSTNHFRKSYVKEFGSRFFLKDKTNMEGWKI